MGRKYREGPRTQVQYQKKREGDQQKPVTTFYVSNLPGGVSRSLLWTAFMPHGVVKDSYVAKKRDVRGNFFGFVRLEGVNNVGEVLKGMNTVKIYEAKLNVSVAKFDKDHRRFTNPAVQEAYVPKNLILPLQNNLCQKRKGFIDLSTRRVATHSEMWLR
ncbi:putative RNA recognition motif domain, nucleotide-binding alpha-beta plait domain superfamily [Helianthus anomalus]